MSDADPHVGGAPRKDELVLPALRPKLGVRWLTVLPVPALETELWDELAEEYGLAETGRSARVPPLSPCEKSSPSAVGLVLDRWALPWGAPRRRRPRGLARGGGRVLIVVARREAELALEDARERV